MEVLEFLRQTFGRARVKFTPPQKELKSWECMKRTVKPGLIRAETVLRLSTSLMTTADRMLNPGARISDICRNVPVFGSNVSSCTTSTCETSSTQRQHGRKKVAGIVLRQEEAGNPTLERLKPPPPFRAKYPIEL